MDFELIKKAMSELDEDTLLSIMKDVMADGGKDAQNALEACRAGMEEVGRLFEDGEYFVGDLIYAGDILTAAIEIITPALVSDKAESCGKIIICTVKDDLHDIGKNIVKALLEAGGFEVHDLGTDVSPETIVQYSIDNGINIIALSGVLTLALDSMKKTVEAFKNSNIRDNVKIIIGGAPTSDDACNTVGADAWAKSPQKTVDICRGWVKL